MRFMILIKGSEADADMPPEQQSEMFEEMGKFNEALAKDGVLLAMEGLRPSSKGKRIRFEGGRTTVTDGPFTESKELIAGFWIVNCKSHEEVVERFKHVPFGDGSVLEIREVGEPEDFGEELAADIREHRKHVGV